jgi:hypothetical protein
MNRRLDAGPLLVSLGAILLLVSLFLVWFEPGLTAWSAFESLDLLLAALAVAALVASFGLLAPALALLERRWLPGLAAAAIVVVASQLVEPPPGIRAGAIGPGAWLALGASLAMVLGAVLTFGRVHFSVSVEGRDVRRRVAAVDARGERGATQPFAPVGSFGGESAANGGAEGSRARSGRG